MCLKNRWVTWRETCQGQEPEMAFCPFTILLPIVCGLIAGTPQPVITEHNTLFMRQEWNRKLLRQVSKYICPASFLQTKGDTYPEQRPPGQGRWWRRWWRSWCRWVCDGSHWCICRSSLLLLYHLQQLINLRRDGGPSHQLQWTHSWGMFRSVIAEESFYLHCPELISYEQRGWILHCLTSWRGLSLLSISLRTSWFQLSLCVMKCFGLEVVFVVAVLYFLFNISWNCFHKCFGYT